MLGGSDWRFGDGQAAPCMAWVHGWCMASVHSIGAWWLGFGVSINDVVYYLDGGVVGLVRFDLSIVNMILLLNNHIFESLHMLSKGKPLNNS